MLTKLRALGEALPPPAEAAGVSQPGGLTVLWSYLIQLWENVFLSQLNYVFLWLKIVFFSFNSNFIYIVNIESS